MSVYVNNRWLYDSIFLLTPKNRTKHVMMWTPASQVHESHRTTKHRPTVVSNQISSSAMSSIPRTSRMVFVNRNTCLFNDRIAINNSLLSCPDDPDPGFSLVGAFSSFLRSYASRAILIPVHALRRARPGSFCAAESGPSK